MNDTTRTLVKEWQKQHADKTTQYIADLSEHAPEHKEDIAKVIHTCAEVESRIVMALANGAPMEGMMLGIIDTISSILLKSDMAFLISGNDQGRAHLLKGLINTVARLFRQQEITTADGDDK